MLSGDVGQDLGSKTQYTSANNYKILNGQHPAGIWPPYTRDREPTASGTVEVDPCICFRTLRHSLVFHVFGVARWLVAALPQHSP